MKKAFLTLLLCAMITTMTSCNKINNINQTETNNNHMTLRHQSVYSDNNIFKKAFFLSYNDILNRYRDLLLNNCNAANAQFSLENDCIIEDALQSVIINSHTNCMGYAVHDLNNDGETELLLLDEKYNIYAAFSQINETPILLDVFTLNNNFVSLDKDGIFYKTGYGKGENSYTKIMQISDNGGFEILLEYGCYDDGIDHEYYVVEQNAKRVTSLQEILVLQEHYSVFLKNPSNITQNSGILFIPIIEK